MKTIITAAILTALSLTNFAKAEQPTPPPGDTPNKQQTTKKLTTEELGEMLDNLGYATRPSKNKDGKIVGYYFDLSRGSTKITLYASVSAGTNIWIDTNMITFDDKTPPTTEMLLAFLGTQDQLWPAYLVYYPKTKLVQMALSVEVAGLTPTILNKKIESMMDKFNIVLEAYKKVKAAEQKAQDVGKPDANPLP